MADTLTTTTNAEFIPEIVAQVALGQLRNSSVLLPTVTRHDELTTAKVGDKVKVPKRGAVSVNDKTATNAVTLQNPTATVVEVTLDKHKEITFLLEDVAAAMENQSSLEGYIQDGMISLAEQVDTDILALYAGLSNDVGTGGTDLTPDTIVDARKTLTDNKAPMTERYLVMASKDEAALLKTEKFTSAAWMEDAGQALKEAMLGRRYGFSLLVHQGVPTSGSSPTNTHCIAYQKGAFVVATRPLPTPPAEYGAKSVYVTDPKSGLGIRVTHSWNADYLGVQVTLDVLYGVAELRDELAVEVLT